MFSVEGHCEGFTNRLRDTVEALEGAGKNVRRSLLESFVAGLAADEAATPNTVSSVLMDKVPGVKNGTAKVYRSTIVRTFKEPGALAALRKAIPTPERLTVVAFEEAVRTYADGVTILDGRNAAKAKEKPTESVSDVPDLQSEPAADPILTAQTLALQGIAALANNRKGAAALRAVLNAAIDAVRPHLKAEEMRELQLRLTPKPQAVRAPRPSRKAA